MISEVVYGVEVLNSTEIIEGIVSGLSDVFIGGFSLVGGIMIGCFLAYVLWRGVL